MNSDFAAVMRRALDHTRAGSLDKATADIQAALAGKRLSEDGPRGSTEQTPRPSPRPRRSLKEVVDALTRKRSCSLAPLMPGQAPRTPAARPDVPAGAEFQSRSFASAHGARDYRLYIPSRHADGLRGLVIMLHGCTQNPDDFAAGTGMNALAETHGLLIAYPGQTSADNPSACWNWFRPGDQRRDRGEPALLAGLSRSLVSEFTLDPARVFVAGLSAGGAMAAVLAATYPDLFAAAGVHSGLSHGSASDVVSAFAAMRGDFSSTRSSRPSADGSSAPRLIVFHGRADRTVHPANAERLIEASGHDLSRAEVMPGVGGGGRPIERMVWQGADGAPEAELWLIEGAGHAWAGGRPEGSYTDPEGPDASAEMIRFFLNDPR